MNFEYIQHLGMYSSFEVVGGVGKAKDEKSNQTKKIFREIDSFLTLEKMLVSRNLCQKSAQRSTRVVW